MYDKRAIIVIVAKIFPSDQDHLREYRKSSTLYQKSPMYDKRALYMTISKEPYTQSQEPHDDKRALYMTKETYV